jgi:PAS domain S-box-containing protein
LMPQLDETLREPEQTGLDNSDHPRSFLAAIVESSDDAIISKNLHGIITSWNEAASRIFGYTAEEIIGQPILRLIPEELRHEEEMILSKLKSGERIDHYETTRIRKDGERFEISVTISPIRDSKGHIIGASKTARDISERKKIEQVLVQSEKLAATGRMAATIAHEINNPLESVMNLVFLARTSGAINKARGYLQTAEKELERVAHIVRQTLGYYRETAAPVRVDLREVMEDVLTVYQTKLSINKIAVDCRFDNHRPLVVNKGELVQVLSNVVANSIDAMPQGGVLHVEIRETTNSQKEGVQIVITDNGTGIQQEHLSKIFEPFFTTKGNLGTGIGLWVAKQLIEKQHGQISITSCTDSEDSGTTLSIFLPFADPQSADPAEGYSSDANTKRC